MKITIGEWKTRDGRKAIVAAENPKASTCFRFIGWIGEESCSWDSDGSWVAIDAEHDNDLIAPWTEPVQWDWSTTPPWINWIFRKETGGWLLSDIEPLVTEHGHGWKTIGQIIKVPEPFHPKWSGDWKLSKTMRPKEAAK